MSVHTFNIKKIRYLFRFLQKILLKNVNTENNFEQQDLHKYNKTLCLYNN